MSEQRLGGIFNCVVCKKTIMEEENDLPELDGDVFFSHKQHSKEEQSEAAKKAKKELV